MHEGWLTKKNYHFSFFNNKFIFDKDVSCFCPVILPKNDHLKSSK